MMSTRSGRVRPSMVNSSPPRSRKGVSPTRSPARTRKSSPPARSPSRKSPARKSPSRKPASKFPARKSPSRTTKEVIETAQKSPAKRSVLSEVEVKLHDFATKETYRSVRTRRSEYSIKDYGPSLTTEDALNGFESELSRDIYGIRNRKPVEEVAPRRSSRLRESSVNGSDIRRSLSKSVSKSLSKSISQSIDTYSDGENSEVELQREKSKSVTRRLATPLRESAGRLTQSYSKWEFGGRIGSALLILLIPLTVFSILISCTNICSVQPLKNLSALHNVSLWFSSQAALVFSVQVVIQGVFAVLPILGIKADRMDNADRSYTFNAFFSSLFTITTLFALDFFQIFSSDTLLKEYTRLAVVSYLFALVLSVTLFLKSCKYEELNPYGSTGYVLYDFWMGREIHPFIKNLDVKIWVSRISNISALILAVLIFKRGFYLKAKDIEVLALSPNNYKEIWDKLQLQPTIILFSMMQINYLLNFIMREYRVTTTFFWQCEGMGYYQIVSSILYPFYFTTISKFVADANLSLSTNTLISSAVVYILGFFLMLISNNIKYEFRKNPLELSLINLDSMPTFHGKKLLISNTWGLLRHPNYLGDIVIHISLAIPGIVSQNYIAAAPALLTIVMLLHRAWRDHGRCQRRYGSAWQRYCKRVPSAILPKIL